MALSEQVRSCNLPGDDARRACVVAFLHENDFYNLSDMKVGHSAVIASARRSFAYLRLCVREPPPLV